jgi:hypothetical protein
MSRKYDRKDKLNAAIKASIDDPHFIIAMAKAMTKKKPKWMPEFAWKIVFNLVIDFPVRQLRNTQSPPAASGTP